MREILSSLSTILFAAALLLGANGLQTTLLALRADREGFPILVVGGLMTVYYIGYVAGCRMAPGFIRQAGHIRAFTAFASIASAITLLHLLLVSPAFWLVLRIATGFCFAALTMILESWMNERASNKNRGQVLGVYRLVDFGSVTASQTLIAMGDVSGFSLFALTSVFISFALAPIALTRSPAPQPISSTRLDFARLFTVSPLACAGVFVAGAANSGFWAVAPVFITGLGHTEAMAGWFMTAVILGSAMIQWPAGFLSDHVDRRVVIFVMSTSAALLGGALAWASSGGALTLLVLGGLYGAAAMSLFGLSVAHANDYAEPETYVQTNGGLLLLSGVGAIIGPIAAALAIQWLGPLYLFVFTAVTHTALAAFAVVRSLTGRRAPETAEPFVSVPRSTPVVFEMDPRAGGEQEEGPVVKP